MQLKQDLSGQILSDVTIFNKYAKHLPAYNRRETWDEIVERNMQMHMDRFPKLKDEIYKIYSNYVKTKLVLPSMRSMQFAGKPIELNNSRLFNCLAKETRFITAEGVKSFENFSDGDTVRVLTHKGNWKNAKVKCYNKQSLYKLKFHRGRTERIVYATKDHRWILKNQEVTTDIRINDSLPPPPAIFKYANYDEMTPDEKIAWCYGFVFGDGTLNKSNDQVYSIVRLCDKKRRFAKRFTDMGFKITSPKSCNGDFIVYTGLYDKEPLDIAIDDHHIVMSFVQGYLDADGHKNTNFKKTSESPFAGIQSSGEKSINFIKTVFESVGVYILKEYNLTGQRTNYGTRPTTFKFSISSSLGKSPATAWTLKEKEKTDRYEDVWCLEVEEDHSFVLSGGIVTGNCSYCPVNNYKCFSEIMFLLLGGTGVGYSIQRHHIEQLPTIRKSLKNRRYVINDSIEGWADSINVLFKSYMLGKPEPRFIYDDIRPKGSKLVTSGGKAPGPQPLKDCIHNLRKILDSVPDGEQLTTLQVHDICCYIADAVLAGGIRRAAMIAFFNIDDEDMLTCKFGKWYELNPQRARANNSAVIVRSKITEEVFFDLWNKIREAGSGEPGIFFTNDAETLSNPCCEIAIKANQFCNLTTINKSNLIDQQDLVSRAKAAAFIGTLQASYTDFHYLRPSWQRATERDALLGVSATGIASGHYKRLDIKEAAEMVLAENERVARLIGINLAARTTCGKPEGTASLVLNTSSGIHSWHDYYYIRRLGLKKNDALYQYMENNHPYLIEDDYFKPKEDGHLVIPQKAPEGAILRPTETAIDLLERVKYYHKNWIRHGHRKGNNTHNISTTVSIKENEWDTVGSWMWKNRRYYNGIATLPYSGADYKHMPFESISKEQYEEMYNKLTKVDLKEIKEADDETDLSGEIACSNGQCELVF